jgi:hypothetical protein
MSKFADNCFISTRTDDADNISVLILKDDKHVELNLMTFSMLMRKFDAITTAAKYVREHFYTKYKCHIGHGYYVRVDNTGCCVDIRRFCKSSAGDIVPTHDAVSLSFAEWEAMHDVVPSLDLPAIEHCSDSHANQLSFLWCFECNPFDCCNY